MKCAHCDNEARYITADPSALDDIGPPMFVCGLCDLLTPAPSVRISDVSALLWRITSGWSIEGIQELICKKR